MHSNKNKCEMMRKIAQIAVKINKRDDYFPQSGATYRGKTPIKNKLD